MDTDIIGHPADHTPPPGNMNGDIPARQPGSRKRSSENDSDEEADEDPEPAPTEEQYIPIDRGTITATRQKAEQRVEEVKPKPAYFPMQETLAHIVVNRIQDILWLHCKKNLSDFKNFDFQIYTARSTALEKQTFFRVMDPFAECFPKHRYQSPDVLCEEAGARVHMYNMHGKRERARLEELKRKAQDQPHTMILIVADEAHWGRGRSEDKSANELLKPTENSEMTPAEDRMNNNDSEDVAKHVKVGTKHAKRAKTSEAGANNQLVNCWNDAHPNVFLLLVTATGFNLKVKEARLDTDQKVAWMKPNTTPSKDVSHDEGRVEDPTASGMDSSCREPDRKNLHLVTKQSHGQHYLYTNTSQRVADEIERIYSLHHLRWTEGHEDKFKKGVVMKLRVANKVNLNRTYENNVETCHWLAIGEENTDTGLCPLVVTSDTDKAIELLLQGNNNDNVMISDSSEDHKLVCLRSRSVEIFGFMRIDEHALKYNAPNVADKFKVHMNMGEDVLCLQVADNERGYFSLDSRTSQITLARPPANQSSSNDLPRYSLEYTFLVDYTRSRDQLKPGLQYMSLNFYYNTMRNPTRTQQLLRADPHFTELLKKLCKKGEKSAPSSDDFLAADYAYHILLVDKMRESKLVCRSLKDLLTNPTRALGDYTTTRTQLLNELMRKLDATDETRTVTCTSGAVKSVVDHMKNTLSSAVREVADWTDLEEVFPVLVDCLLHLSTEDLLEEFAQIDPDVCKQWTSKEFNKVKRDFRNIKRECLEQSETYKVVARVVKDVPGGGIDGQMVVVRASSVPLGNMFYATLCCARQVASKKKFKFEVIRDFEKFELSNIMKEEVDTPKYRMHSRLQPKKCEYRDPHSLQRCDEGHNGGPCYDYDAIQPPLKCRRCDHVHREIEVEDEESENQPNICEFREVGTSLGCRFGLEGRPCDRYEPVDHSLTCTKCGHFHKEIKDYSDCNKLPCILILVNKGRLGDTFPESFFAMDLRLSFKSLPYLSSLMQELGRLCRYAEKPMGGDDADGEYDKLPYALISSKLEHCLAEGLNRYAVLYGIFVEKGLLDPHIRATKQSRKPMSPKKQPGNKGVQKSTVDIQGPQASMFVSQTTHGTLPAAQAEAASDMEQKMGAADDEDAEEVIEYKAAKTNADHGNEVIHHNRLLLEAEPQIGKTGVYLKTISILRKNICPDVPEESDESDNDPVSSSDDEENGADASGVTRLSESGGCRENVDEDEDVWRYPYWKKMEVMKFPKFTGGKYAATAGSKGQQTSDKSAKPKNPSPSKKAGKSSDSFSPSTLRAYSYSDPSHASCTMCSDASSTRDMEVDIGGCTAKLSVPMLRSYVDLIKVLTGSDEADYNDTIYQDIEFSMSMSSSQHGQGGKRPRPTPSDRTLKSWVFTPTYRRPDTATLNYRHTMVQGPNLEKCYYVHILVVRREDFDAYYTIYNSTHAILQLPQVMPDCEKDVNEGGIGYARLFIQRFAEHYDLRQVFLLDDNITCAREVVTKDRLGRSVLIRDGETLQMKEVPLFKLLKHLEDQFHSADAPVWKPFERWDNHHDNHLGSCDFEQYTGPSNMYGALGCLKERKGMGRCKVPHKKTNVYSLVLLNIRNLEFEGIKYKPTFHREDIELYKECNDKGLWVCKYNRFIIRKLHLKSAIIEPLYCWNDEDRIPHGRTKLLPASSSRECLYRGIRQNYPPGRTEEVPRVQPESEMCQRFRRIKKGSFHLLVYLGPDMKGLELYYRHTEGIGGFGLHLLLFDIKFCQKKNLKQRLDFKALVVDGMFEDVEAFEVYTSHNIQKFRVQLILLKVHGKIKSPLDDTSIFNTIKPKVKHIDLIALRNRRQFRHNDASNQDPINLHKEKQVNAKTPGPKTTPEPAGTISTGTDRGPGTSGGRPTQVANIIQQSLPERIADGREEAMDTNPDTDTNIPQGMDIEHDSSVPEGHTEPISDQIPVALTQDPTETLPMAIVGESQKAHEISGELSHVQSSGTDQDLVISDAELMETEKTAWEPHIADSELKDALPAQNNDQSIPQPSSESQPLRTSADDAGTGTLVQQTDTLPTIEDSYSAHDQEMEAHWSSWPDDELLTDTVGVESEASTTCNSAEASGHNRVSVLGTETTELGTSSVHCHEASSQQRAPSSTSTLDQTLSNVVEDPGSESDSMINPNSIQASGHLSETDISNTTQLPQRDHEDRGSDSDSTMEPSSPIQIIHPLIETDHFNIVHPQLDQEDPGADSDSTMEPPSPKQTTNSFKPVRRPTLELDDSGSESDSMIDPSRQTSPHLPGTNSFKPVRRPTLELDESGSESDSMIDPSRQTSQHLPGANSFKPVRRPTLELDDSGSESDSMIDPSSSRQTPRNLTGTDSTNGIQHPLLEDSVVQPGPSGLQRTDPNTASSSRGADTSGRDQVPNRDVNREDPFASQGTPPTSSALPQQAELELHQFNVYNDRKRTNRPLVPNMRLLKTDRLVPKERVWLSKYAMMRMKKKYNIQDPKR